MHKVLSCHKGRQNTRFHLQPDLRKQYVRSSHTGLKFEHENHARFLQRCAPSLSSQGRDPQPQLRMEAGSTHFQTGRMLPGIRPTNFAIFDRNGKDGFWKTTSRLDYTSMSQMQQTNRSSVSQSQHGCRHHSEDSPTQRRPPRTGISQSCRDSLTAYPLWKGLAPCLGTKTLRFFPRFVKASQPALTTTSPAVTLRPRRENEPDISHDLLICEGNWQGAESDPALLQELIEEEATAGFLEEMPSLEAAFARWGRDRVAVGKVNIVKAPGRAARLVIDNSVCNTNQNCTVPEQFSLPSLQDIQAAYPLREDSEPVAGFSLDVKGAHKTALVREQDRGLLGLRQQERLFFYRVCPFGATFSSHWFSRLGGFFTRCLHLLIWISHVLMLYVDDLLFWQNEKVLPLSAALILAFCSCFRIPLSWRKLQLGPAITWIGWEINFGAGCFTLPEAKRTKWLCSLYDAMHRPLGTNVGISPTSWPGLHAFLDENLRFTANPPGTGITAGSTLLSARHRALQRKADLALVPVSTKRIWLRVADPTSSKRRLSQASRETLEFFTHLAAAEWRPRPLRPAPASEVTSAADAFGKANDCGVGGWLRLPSDKLVWFSQRYTVHDFTALGMPMQADANLDISSYETLAQCFLLLAFWKSQGAGRLAITLPALSDNSGAESVCNKLYTSKVPLNLFVRKLSMWSAITGITLDCSHIAGEKNDDADLLSRWDGTSPLPGYFAPADRIELSLREFWDVRFEVALFPADTFLLWELPAPHTLGPTNRGSPKRK